MSGYVVRGGHPPTSIEWRYCPKDAGHWRTDGDRCPVCRSKIATKVYATASAPERST